MCSKHIDADFVFAWPKAEIAVMGAEGAIQILYAKEVQDPNKAQVIEEKLQEYRETVMTPKTAAEQGYVSEVINPEDTRRKISQCLRLLKGKKPTSCIEKKHGNIPL